MPRPPIDGGVVLVTGASSGIGRAIVRTLGGRPRAVAVTARRTERLEELKRELEGAHPDLRVLVVPCDLGDRVATDRMLESVHAELGPVDVLVNNAGFGDFGPYDRAPWSKTADMIELNITTLAYLTHRVLPGMVERGRGGVFNVSSGFGLQFLPGFAAYVGTKHFVTGFTESLRLDLAGTGVAVTQLCPGPVDTEFVERARMGRTLPFQFTKISAERCARAAVRGFDAGRAMVIPGLMMKFILLLGALTPRFLLRLIYRPVAAVIRRM